MYREYLWSSKGIWYGEMVQVQGCCSFAKIRRNNLRSCLEQLAPLAGHTHPRLWRRIITSGEVDHRDPFQPPLSHHDTTAILTSIGAKLRTPGNFELVHTSPLITRSIGRLNPAIFRVGGNGFLVGGGGGCRGDTSIRSAGPFGCGERVRGGKMGGDAFNVPIRWEEGLDRVVSELHPVDIRSDWAQHSILK